MAAERTHENLVPADVSPQQKLTASRMALIRHMSGNMNAPVALPDGLQEGNGESLVGKQQSSFESGSWGLLKLGIRAWWHQQPAHLALAVVQPMLQRYATRKPFQLLVISAAAGAVIVALKPWRLMSLGGLALAALKSSEFSGFVASVLSSRENEGSSRTDKKKSSDQRKTTL